MTRFGSSYFFGESVFEPGHEGRYQRCEAAGDQDIAQYHFLSCSLKKEKSMSDKEKKNDEYEKPESKGMGDDLENVSGGKDSDAQACVSSYMPDMSCHDGNDPLPRWSCSQGAQATR